jgi:NTE family protein
MDNDMKKVQLVLGSGGARGIAHIGVIERLLEDGYEIESIAGCSMGAVIGGMYCAGYLDAYKEWLLTLNKSDVFSLMDFTWSQVGFIKGDRVFDIMRHITGEQRIEDFDIPFVAVAADLLTYEEVYFDKGDLYDALRASIAIPGVFTPVWGENAVWVDGGVLNPVPVNRTRKKEGSIVIAVNLNGPDLPGSMQTNGMSMQVSEDLDAESWFQKMRWQWMTKENNGNGNMSMVDLLKKSYSLTQHKLIDMHLKLYQPDVVVEIPKSAGQTFDFYKAESMIEIGKSAYNQAMKKAGI